MSNPAQTITFCTYIAQQSISNIDNTKQILYNTSTEEDTGTGKEENMQERRLDRIRIKDLLVRGILGINPDERSNRQDILVNVTMWADTQPAAASDAIEDAVNYKTITKAILAHVENGAPMLVERLVAEVARIALEKDERVQAVEVSVEKPTALRFAGSVGITIYRTRAEVLGVG
jgi:FolB domain-containing protein